MMCSTQPFDSMMDQAPFVTEDPQIYTPALNLLHHKILCFKYRNEVLTSAMLSETELDQLKSRLGIIEKILSFLTAVG